MLFNSYIFIFLFLPVCVAGFYVIGRILPPRAAFGWLILGSLVFYGYWNPLFVLLILVSVVFNYFIGILINKNKDKTRKILFTTGITFNLTLLVYYKYTNFFADTISDIFQVNIEIGKIVLPIAISFFTFQQIAYIVDVYRIKAKEYDFLHYFLFIAFFPQLIAGPIVHHQEMVPQFERKKIFLKSSDLSVGLSIFFMGLFKKTIIADGIAPYADSLFNIAGNGTNPMAFEAWGGVLAFTFQIYFDFSAYSDMAIGVGRMFGIKLPLNFDSPYKSTSIIDFWRCWHMTLSRFLKDYVYIPMGGNRSGRFRQFINLMITMLLGGLWHGANWTFVLWGGLHGIFITLNHVWRLTIKDRFKARSKTVGYLSIWLCRVITFTSVVFAWVLFRSENINAALSVYKGMIGLNGISIPMPIVLKLGVKNLLQRIGIIFPLDGAREFSYTYFWIITLLFFVWFLPNVKSIMQNYEPVILSKGYKTIKGTRYFRWSPTASWAGFVSFISALALVGISKMNAFIYFQF
jgi:alginate O-acetyltransferase complex protein AlgI